MTASVRNYLIWLQQARQQGAPGTGAGNP